MFANIPERKEFSDFKKVQYLRIVPNTALRIRILDKEANLTFKHYIPLQRVSVVCLGEECPICVQNKKLIAENQGVPTNQIRGYLPRSTRFSVNVLNRTLVKMTDFGDVVYPDQYGKFPKATASGEDLTKIQAKPLDRVEVLERGPQLFQQLNMYNINVVDENDEPIGIWNYDLVISATGSGRSMVTNVVPQPQKNDEVDVAEDDLFNLDTIGIELSVDEMWKLISGVSFSDIMASRSAEDFLEGSETEVDESVGEVVDKSIDELFN